MILRPGLARRYEGMCKKNYWFHLYHKLSTFHQKKLFLRTKAHYASKYQFERKYLTITVSLVTTSIKWQNRLYGNYISILTKVLDLEKEEKRPILDRKNLTLTLTELIFFLTIFLLFVRTNFDVNAFVSSNIPFTLRQMWS